MKHHAFIILLIFCSVSAFAQKRLLRPEISFGAQGGYMASMVNFNPSVAQQPLKCYLGPTAGLVFRYAEHKVCGIQVELNYMQRGWRESNTGYSRQMDYIEIPMLCHLSFGRRFRGFINLGPQVGYLLHEKELTPSSVPNAWADKLSSKEVHQYAQTGRDGSLHCIYTWRRQRVAYKRIKLDK